MKLFEIIDVEKTGYGYEMDNPIKAMSVGGSYAYLNALKPKVGIVFRWDRDGCYSCENSKKLIDKYFIYVLKSKERPLKFFRYTLYIDMYNIRTDEEKPEDFC